ncbi:MAG TPA: trypsin-like peptidase domain-containing protein [Solirubrobacteraceae bacterium]|nr:trypsin-like peptidase domain-containing protein [Solirubrobacteraceae bacterium]
MKTLLRSQFTAAVLGGLVTTGALLALGVVGRRTTRTIIEESPIAAQPASAHGSGLTPHAIYERDAPGVVFVRALVIQQVQDPFDLFPQREQSTSTGSGFLISSGGLILTNFHVIEGADRATGVTVQFVDNVTRRATVVGQDPNNDLALLKVDMPGVPPVQPLPLGESGAVRVGDPTLAIGNPFGLDRTLTSGIVSALQRQIEAPDGFSIDNVIQTDAPINPGNSGGPLLDATGRVIGINSQIETGGAGGTGSVGIGFAVPIDTAKQFLLRLQRGAPVEVAFLGVSAGAGTSTHGARVHVEAGGPAANGGLTERDVIESIDGRGVSTAAQVQAYVATRKPGQSVTLRVLRGGTVKTLRIVLGSKTTQPAK